MRILGSFLRLAAAVTLLAVFLPASSTPGVFRGIVIEPPRHAEADGDWIYVEGKNHAVRRVDVAKADVTYDDEFPQESRMGHAVRSLDTGAEVRVTATQDKQGEWHASKVEVLWPADGKGPALKSVSLRRR